MSARKRQTAWATSAHPTQIGIPLSKGSLKRCGYIPVLHEPIIPFTAKRQPENPVSRFSGCPFIGGLLPPPQRGTNGLVRWALSAHAFHVCPKAANRVGNKCPPYTNRHPALQRQPETVRIHTRPARIHP
nr:hypothetical protein [uncultured Kingella sp.]